MPTATLIVIHPKEMIRLGLLSVLKDTAAIKVAGQGANGKEALKLTKQHEPDLVLLYDQLDDQDTFDVARTLAESSPGLKVVMVGIEESPTYLARAAVAGVHDYLLEGSTVRHILETLKNVVSGKPAGGNYGSIKAQLQERTPNPQVRLTPRELQILRHIGYGLTNDEITRSLQISIDTVKEHVETMLRKMVMRDRTQLAVWAVNERLV